MATDTLELRIEEGPVGGVQRSVEAAEESTEEKCLALFPGQFFRSFALAMFSLLLECYMLNIVNSRMPDPQRNPPLPDVMLETFPRYNLEYYTNGIIFIMTVLSFSEWAMLVPMHLAVCGSLPGWLKKCCCFVGPILERLQNPSTEAERENNKIEYTWLFAGAWCRFWVAWSIASILRALCLLCTALPPTDNHCQHPTVIDNWVKNAVVGLISMGNGQHCGDLMFSGHMVIVACCGSAMWYFATWISRGFRVIVVICVIVSTFTIICSRSHYTIDVIVALYVSPSVFALVPNHVPQWLVPLISPFSPRQKMQRLAWGN